MRPQQGGQTEGSSFKMTDSWRVCALSGVVCVMLVHAGVCAVREVCCVLFLSVCMSCICMSASGYACCVSMSWGASMMHVCTEYACHMYFIGYVQKVCWVLCSYHVCVICVHLFWMACMPCMNYMHCHVEYAFCEWFVWYMHAWCGQVMSAIWYACCMHATHVHVVLVLCTACIASACPGVTCVHNTIWCMYVCYVYVCVCVACVYALCGTVCMVRCVHWEYVCYVLCMLCFKLHAQCVCAVAESRILKRQDKY